MLQPEQQTALRKKCLDWISLSLKDFDPKGVKLYTIDQLYHNDVEFSGQQQDDVVTVYKSLWDKAEFAWKGVIPDGWIQFDKSIRSLTLEHPDYPGYVFKFCSGSPSKGNKAAHFLRVPKGKELHRIVREEKLGTLDIVVEQLIAIKTSYEMKLLFDDEQAYQFIVKSIKLPLYNTEKTIEKLLSKPKLVQERVAEHIMKLICKSGLGDVGFHNILYDPATDKLVIVDTEPLYGSLLLDEPSLKDDQYKRTRVLIGLTNNLDCAITGLDMMIRSSSSLPIFKQVAEIYKDCMLQTYKK